jgi:hypothetical protein
MVVEAYQTFDKYFRLEREVKDLKKNLNQVTTLTVFCMTDEKEKS